MEYGISRARVMPAPWYKPLIPSCRTTPIVLSLCSGGCSICICILILTISIGLVAVTWQKPARAPLSASKAGEMEPSSLANRSRNMSFTVSLMAFSGATPVTFAPSPLYRPRAPS